MDFEDVYVSDSNQTIGHLGLVAGSYDELNIGTIIDRLIPKSGPHALTHGDIVKAITIKGLGYTESHIPQSFKKNNFFRTPAQAI